MLQVPGRRAGQRRMESMTSWTRAGEDDQPADGSHEQPGYTRTQIHTRQCPEHQIKICTKKNNQNYTNITHQFWKHAAQDLSESFEAKFWAQVLKPNFNVATQEIETVSKR